MLPHASPGPREDKGRPLLSGAHPGLAGPQPSPQTPRTIYHLSSHHAHLCCDTLNTRSPAVARESWGCDVFTEQLPCRGSWTSRRTTHRVQGLPGSTETLLDPLLENWALSWGGDTQQVTGTSLCVCILTHDLQHPGRTRGNPRKSGGRAGSVARGLREPRLKEKRGPTSITSYPRHLLWALKTSCPLHTHTPPLNRKEKSKEMK